MRRIKLNDRVTFPLYLDLNPIITGKRAPTQKQSKPPQDEEEEEEDEDMERGDKGKGRADHQDHAQPRITPSHFFSLLFLFSLLLVNWKLTVNLRAKVERVRRGDPSRFTSIAPRGAL